MRLPSKKWILIASGVIIALLATIFALVGNTPKSSYKRYPTIENADSVYKDAVVKIDQLSDIELNVIRQKKLNVIADTEIETATQRILYIGLRNSDFLASVDETITVGQMNTHITEVFENGIVYQTVAGTPFSGECTRDDFLSRNTPAAILSPERYRSVSGVNAGTHYIITFYDGTAFESWFKIPYGKLLFSQGKAYIDKKGNLFKSEYNVSYKLNDIIFRCTFQVEIVQNSTNTIQIPTNKDAYTRLSDPKGPRMLEIASGYLLSAKSIHSKYDSQLFCQAFGDKRKETIDLTLHNGKSWSAECQTNTTLTNASRIDDISQRKIIQKYTDGIYSISTNDSPFETRPNHIADSFLSECRNTLLGTVMLPQYITDVTAYDNTETLYLSFTASDDFVQRVMADTLQILYNNPTIMDEIAEAYETKNITCYLILNSRTFLPIGSGILYEGVYTVGNIPYSLTSEFNQTYKFSAE